MNHHVFLPLFCPLLHVQSLLLAVLRIQYNITLLSLCREICFLGNGRDGEKDVGGMCVCECVWGWGVGGGAVS